MNSLPTTSLVSSLATASQLPLPGDGRVGGVTGVSQRAFGPGQSIFIGPDRRARVDIPRPSDPHLRNNRTTAPPHPIENLYYLRTLVVD